MSVELPKEIAVSLRSLSWAQIAQYLASEDTHERASVVIDTLLREGYLTIRHRDPKLKATRDAFLASLNQFIQGAPFAGLRDRLSAGTQNARATEALYEEVLAQVDETIENEAPAAVA